MVDAVAHAGDVAARRLVEAALDVAFEQLEVARHDAQRLGDVMGGDTEGGRKVGRLRAVVGRPARLRRGFLPRHVGPFPWLHQPL